MTLVGGIFAVVFGLVFGSFLNVCIARLPRHESIIRPPSRCPSCSTPIRPYDNIPVLSWLLLRGRCRQCRCPISWRYPLIEIATAALFLLVFLVFGLTLNAAGMALLCFLLLGMAIMDAETLLLPDAFTLPGIALGILFQGLTFGWLVAVKSIVAALAAAVVILLIRWIYLVVRGREGMGLGDAKLFALIAAWLGPWQAILVFFLAVVCAAVFGIVTNLIKRGQGNRSLPVPFGSFLCAAAIFAIFQGENILKWYLKFVR